MSKFLVILKYILVVLLVLAAIERLPSTYLIAAGLISQNLDADTASHFIDKLFLNVALFAIYIYFAYRLMRNIKSKC